MPKIAVLMATCNGIQWLPEQISTIFCQTGVEVTLFVSDDFSNDGTAEYLDILSKGNSNIIVLPQNRFGSAGRNFYRLICDVNFSDFDYVAFADQDDIWFGDKLIHAVSSLKSSEADGFSSDVIAFWPNGRKLYVRKSQPQRRYDYFFESAGPGCTFVLTCHLASTIKLVLVSNNKDEQSFFNHDWLIYALARGNGYKWVVANTPSLMYRQHQSNETGVNSGLRAIFMRIGKLRSGWFLNHVFHLGKILNKESLLEKIIDRNCLFRSRFFLHFSQCRRRISDRIFLLLVIMLRIAK